MSFDRRAHTRILYIALVVAVVARCGGGGGGADPPSGPNPPTPPASQTVFTHSSELASYAIYLPPGTTTYRGVFLLAPGFGGDSRVIADRRFPPGGNGGLPFDGPEIQGYRALAEEHGLAVMGARLRSNPTALNSLEDLVAALEELAAESQHPELATAPLLLDGFSNGGCFAYAFTRRFPERVIGFRTQKGGCHYILDGGAAKQVPGFLNIGGADTQARCLNITAAFESNRPAGALWALAVEPGAGHVPIHDLDVLLGWMEAVLSLRLPAAVGGGLRPIAEESGWLGNRETAAVASFAAYEQERSQASWLPSAETAQAWSEFVAPGRPLACPADPPDQPGS